MQVDLSVVLASASGVVSLLFGGYVALLRYTLETKEAALETRHNDLVEKVEKLQQAVKEFDTLSTAGFRELHDKVNAEEKAALRLDGQLNLLKQSHIGFERELNDFKRAMVTKGEWEGRMGDMRKTIDQMLSDLRGSRYSQQFQAVRPTPKPPSDWPPKDR